MFSPHPNLADNVNRSIVQSEIEGGVFLGDLPPSTVLQIQTLNHCYTAVLLGGSEALLSGHPEFCPQPVQVAIAGSTWGGSMLKLQYVGRGMHLEFRHPEYPTPIITSAHPGNPRLRSHRTRIRQPMEDFSAPSSDLSESRGISREQPAKPPRTDFPLTCPSAPTTIPAISL